MATNNGAMSAAGLKVLVEVWEGFNLITAYTMDHDDVVQRRILGEQCRNALEGGQMVITYREPQS